MTLNCCKVKLFGTSRDLTILGSNDG